MRLSRLQRTSLFLLLFSFNAFAQDLVQLTQNPYHNVNDTFHGLTQIHGYYANQNDRRKLFVKIYFKVTAGIENMISSGEISQVEWWENLIVNFSNAYRDAVWAYESGKLNLVILPWIYDFNHASKGNLGLQTQLVLSLNSHILYDLPVAIASSVDSLYELNKYQDEYFKLNIMFKKLMPNIFQSIYQEANTPNINLNHPSEVLKRKVVYQLVVKMRKLAWERAKSLVEIKAYPEKRRLFLQSMAKQTESLSKLTATLDPYLSTKPGEFLPSKLEPGVLNNLMEIHRLLSLPVVSPKYNIH